MAHKKLDLVNWRDVIVRDTGFTAAKWRQVVDRIKLSPQDTRAIRRLLETDDSAAVLDTLNFWYAFGTEREDLVSPLKDVGMNNVAAYVESKLGETNLSTHGNPESINTSQGYSLVKVQKSDPIWQTILNSMNNSIVEHKDNIGGIFTSYEILKLEKVHNENLTKRYKNRQEEVRRETIDLHERRLFHGTNPENVNNILESGLDERYGDGGMFGAGIYFAEHSSKSNQYVFGKAGCPKHNGNTSCYLCEKKMLICAVTLGTSVMKDEAQPRTAHPPPMQHSLTGIPGKKLQYPEYVIYRGEQANTEYVVTYRIVE